MSLPLKERYLELVNTFVNSPHESGYKNAGAQEGIRTPTSDKGKRILSRSKAHPPAGDVRGVESFLAASSREHHFNSSPREAPIPTILLMVGFERYLILYSLTRD